MPGKPNIEVGNQLDHHMSRQSLLQSQVFAHTLAAKIKNVAAEKKHKHFFFVPPHQKTKTAGRARAREREVEDVDTRTPSPSECGEAGSGAGGGVGSWKDGLVGCNVFVLFSFFLSFC